MESSKFIPLLYKELVFPDLCARLPYRVKGQCKIDGFPTPHIFDAELEGIKGTSLYVIPLIGIEDLKELECANDEVADGIGIFEFKPYLRRMSSMIDEEIGELLCTTVGDDTAKFFQILEGVNTDIKDYWIEFSGNNTFSYIDWLNEHHFDYRGLIETNLAIEISEDDYHKLNG